MFTASSMLLGLVVTLGLGAAITFYLWTVRRRQDAAASGIRALAAMRWREFSQFVLDAMRHRGYDVLTPDDETERGQQTEFLLTKDGQRSLLSCKHGSAYRLAAPAVSELAENLRFQSATSGLLVTPGQIESAARAPARAAGIELIDGATLWPEIAPLLPLSLTEEVNHLADVRAKRQIGFAWLGALAAGAVVAMLGAGAAPAPTPTPTPTPVVVARQQPAVVATAPAAAATVPPVMLTLEEEDAQRQEVIGTISSLPGIDRALWSTRSTLLVHLADDGRDRLTEICAILVRYDSLRASRVQLQPPPGSTQRVRFRQCQAY